MKLFCRSRFVPSHLTPLKFSLSLIAPSDWGPQAFRMQQESREQVRFLASDGKVEDSRQELADVQARHAETVLELQKTRNLLLLEHRITTGLQVPRHPQTPVRRHILTETPRTGGAEHGPAEDGERAGGGQVEDGREGPTFVQKISADQSFTRYMTARFVLEFPRFDQTLDSQPS